MLKTALLVLISWTLCGPATAQDIEQEGNEAIRQGDLFLRQFKAADALASYKEGIRIGQETHNDYMYAMALVGAGQAIWYSGNLTGAADTVELLCEAGAVLMRESPCVNRCKR